MQWSVKHFSELTNIEVYEIIRLRSDVFVVEQQAIYLDCDNKDLNNYHLQLRNEYNELVGYARMLDKGVSYDTYSIGRVIITPSIRGTGLGKQLVERAITFIAQYWKGDAITISAQQRLTRFYESLGFKVESEPYVEDMIAHVQMRLDLQQHIIS